ncbi:MAG: SH3 domain-containing protein [Gemmatimonadetes bacterium]|nr:SH3 domain-containing protein [Gemmatimonadota bacterium]
MRTERGFTMMTLEEFEAWLPTRQVTRTVLSVQEHHTFLPAYAHFTGTNHFTLQQNMKHHHVSANGWSDIGQHFTSFPDGTIVTGRSLEANPACIFGNNQHAICIEHLGNFDTGGDAMTAAHRQTILRMTAAICERFAIPVTADRVVYHHWFDLSTGARTNGGGTTKSCPGTAFFGGNSVEQAQRNFLPKVRALLDGGTIVEAALPAGGYARVTADSLNVRRGPSPTAKKVSAVSAGTVLRVFQEKDGWLRVSNAKDEWVAAKFTAPVERATVRASTLNVRSAPDKTADKVAAVTRGQEVFIHERSDGWCRIGAEPRWVLGAFLVPA